MRQILFSILLVAGCMTVSAQQKFMLPNANPQVKDTEHEIEQYGGISILGVVNPSVEVYLPEASKANGCAVILCPGGGLYVLMILKGMQCGATAVIIDVGLNLVYKLFKKKLLNVKLNSMKH